MPRIGTRPQVPPKDQTNATLTQPNPVSGEKYTVLDTTENVRIIGMIAQCTWTAQPSPLEIHVTIDGHVKTFSQANPISGSWYKAAFNYCIPYMGTGSEDMYRAFLIEGRSVKVEVEITGGTVSELRCEIQWAKWE